MSIYKSALIFYSIYRHVLMAYHVIHKVHDARDCFGFWSELFYEQFEETRPHVTGKEKHLPNACVEAFEISSSVDNASQSFAVAISPYCVDDMKPT